MNTEAAARLLLRLQAHWPSLAASDDAAADWLAVLGRLDVDHATRTADRLIFDWSESWTPKIGNWQEYARACAARPEPTRAIEEPPPDPAAVERVKALLARAQEHLSVHVPKREWTPLRHVDADALTPIVEYDGPPTVRPE